MNALSGMWRVSYFENFTRRIILTTLEPAPNILNLGTRYCTYRTIKKKRSLDFKSGKINVLGKKCHGKIYVNSPYLTLPSRVNLLSLHLYTYYTRESWH